MNTAIETEVLSAIRRLIRATDVDSKQLARLTNLSTSQLLVLALLADEPSRTVGAIAERVGLAQGTVTSMIDRLEERGLVTAEWALTERNRQARFYAITVAGMAWLEEQSADWFRYSDAVGTVLRASDAS
jgi:DNA-binding MarR family transcriptional regulator